MFVFGKVRPEHILFPYIKWYVYDFVPNPCAFPTLDDIFYTSKIAQLCYQTFTCNLF